MNRRQFSLNTYKAFELIGLYTILFWLMLYGVGFSATYYMRNDGSAANKAAATSCSAASTAMNESVHNGETFSATDVITVCDDGGAYNSQITPPSSGSSGAGNQITYQKEVGGSPTLSRNGYGIYAASRSYLKIDGLIFSGASTSQEQLRLGSYSEVTGCTFSGTGLSAIKTGGDYNYIHDNTFNAGADQAPGVAFQDIIAISGDYNRFINNTMSEGGNHTFVWIWNGSFNIIRGNTITMTRAYYDTLSDPNNNSISEVFNIENGSLRNLVEENTVTYTGTPLTSSSSEQFPFQYDGVSYTISRRNVFNNCKGIVNLFNNWYNRQCQYNVYYNNTFYKVNNYLSAYGVWTLDFDKGVDGIVYNTFINNLIHTYTYTGVRKPGPDYGASSTYIHDNLFSTNVMYGSGTPQVYRFGSTYTWAQAEDPGAFPTEFVGTITTEPTFTNAATGDFSPTSGGSQVDSARYLTQANGAGSSSVALIVDNSAFFYDGNGISDESANRDYICIGTSTTPVQITNNDTSTNTLTLASAQTWSNNDNIYRAWSSSVCYSGSGYDIGHEEGLEPDSEAPQPDPAVILTIYPNVIGDMGMTAQAPTDATTPIYTQFTLDNTDCGANAGTGGTSSGWQESDTTYIDDGLQLNQCYGYKAQYKDSVGTPNTGTYSAISSVYSWAAVPGAPTLGNQAQTTFDLTALDGSSNPSANPTTTFACQITATVPADATWLDKWINTVGGAPSASEVWSSEAVWDATITVGAGGALNGGTKYTVKCKAKNGDDVETALGTGTDITTSTPTEQGDATWQGIIFSNITIQ